MTTSGYEPLTFEREIMLDTMRAVEDEVRKQTAVDDGTKIELNE
jgi:hypothetical protein